MVNVYEKVIKTLWVDESGNPLQNPKEGSFPDNDGKSDISGYELVGVKYDEDGNVINVYRKIAAPATPATPAPATPKATQPLPQTGDASSVLGVVGTTIGGLSAAGLGAKLNNRRKRSRK